MLLHLRERSDLEDLGVDSESPNGVVTILTDALNWRRVNAFMRGPHEKEHFMDPKVYAARLPLSTPVLIWLPGR